MKSARSSLVISILRGFKIGEKPVQVTSPEEAVTVGWVSTHRDLSFFGPLWSVFCDTPRSSAAFT